MNLGRRKNSALRKEQEQFHIISNKQNKIFYQKHQTDKNESNTIQFNAVKVKRQIELIPKTVNQENYILALTDKDVDVVIAGGPAGTGKTYLSTLAAIKALRSREYERIVLCRPAVSIENENHGFLPGDLTSKLAPWVRPITDILREFYSIKEIEHMISEEIIEFAPLGFLRGRTFKNTFLILDEAQNASPLQLKSLLTRIGQNSKFVINGDIEQADRKNAENGLLDLLDRLKINQVRGIEVCEFDIRDVQRHHLIEKVLHLYKK